MRAVTSSQQGSIQYRKAFVRVSEGSSCSPAFEGRSVEVADRSPGMKHSAPNRAT